MQLVTETVFKLEVAGKAIKCPVTHLEALVGLLAASNVLASVRDNHDGDLIVVAAKELLCSANNVSDNDGGAQREDKVLVIGVQDKSIVHLACKKRNESS